MDAEVEMATCDGLGGEPVREHGDGFCPECGSADICAQTASDDVTPWGCLDCDHQFEDPERPMFALVVIVEADDAEQAWETVSAGLKDDEATRYVGAPWESIPPATTEFTTAAVALGMTIPVETKALRESGETHAYVTRNLTPCD
jgi:hypothetical protein